jgi:hypothetical protein
VIMAFEASKFPIGFGGKREKEKEKRGIGWKGDRSLPSGNWASSSLSCPGRLQRKKGKGKDRRPSPGKRLHAGRVNKLERNILRPRSKRDDLPLEPAVTSCIAMHNWVRVVPLQFSTALSLRSVRRALGTILRTLVPA